MIRRSTWVLLGIFVVLLGATLYLQRHPLNKAEASPTDALTFLFDVPAERSVHDLKISGDQGNEVEFAAQPSGDWRFVGAIDAPADTTKIEQVLTNVRQMRVLITIQNPLDLKTVGLEPPVYQVVVTLDDGTQQTASIGGPNPTGSGYYAQRSGTGMPLQVVSKTAVDSITGLLTNPPYLPTETPGPTTLPGPLPAEATPTAGP